MYQRCLARIQRRTLSSVASQGLFQPNAAVEVLATAHPCSTGYGSLASFHDVPTWQTIAAIRAAWLDGAGPLSAMRTVDQLLRHRSKKLRERANLAHSRSFWGRSRSDLLRFCSSLLRSLSKPVHEWRMIASVPRVAKFLCKFRFADWGSGRLAGLADLEMNFSSLDLPVSSHFPRSRGIFTYLQARRLEKVNFHTAVRTFNLHQPLR